MASPSSWRRCRRRTRTAAGATAPKTCPEFSRRVERLAADEGAIFLDLFNLMGTYVGYIGIDGLHPTPAGYQKIAELWQEEIQRHFEVTGDPPTHACGSHAGRTRESVNP